MPKAVEPLSQPSDQKLRRMRFTQSDGKENRLSFGGFPGVSLADARARRDEASS